MADAEQEYFKAHSKPGTEPEKDFEKGNVVDLWNFPVRKADLAHAHEVAIRSFASPGYLASSAMDFVVRGHASATGEGKVNTDLALKRAQNVNAVLKELGFLNVVVENGGSEDPAMPGTSQQANARNRFVRVTRSMKSVQVTREPPKPTVTPAAPTPTGQEKGDPPLSVSLDVKINVHLSGIKFPVLVDAWMIGEVKLTVADSRGPFATRVVKHVEGDPAPALTDNFQETLAAYLNQKLGLAAKPDGGSEATEVGSEVGPWFLSPKLTHQERPNAVYIDFKQVDKQLLIVPFGEPSTQVQLFFSGNLRFDVGPSDRSFFFRGRPSTAPKDPLMIAGTVHDATKQVPQLHQPEIEWEILNLASLDGAASKIAWEILGADGEVGFNQRQLDWRKAGGEAFVTGWNKGAVDADTILLSSGDKGTERMAGWKAKYGAEPNGKDFDVVRERVFVGLKGYGDNQGDLKGLIEGL